MKNRRAPLSNEQIQAFIKKLRLHVSGDHQWTNAADQGADLPWGGENLRHCAKMLIENYLVDIQAFDRYIDGRSDFENSGPNAVSLEDWLRSCI